VSGVSGKNDYSMWRNAFWGVSSPNLTIRSAFASAKGFIHFAFCILNFAFLNIPPPPKLMPPAVNFAYSREYLHIFHPTKIFPRKISKTP
jgi:hypothetical protein